MRILKLLPIFAVILLFQSCNNGSSAGKSAKGLSQFLDELTSAAQLEQAPDGEVVLLSSFDQTGGNQDWGNYDKPADPDGMVTIAFFEGPGVIRRIWMTGQYPDSWEFFFDGESTPRISGLSTSKEPITDAQSAFSLLHDMKSGGVTTYMPIPYKTSLRIAVPEDFKPARPYYQIVSESFKKDVRIESFPKNHGAELKTKIQQVATDWDNLEKQYTLSVSQKVEKIATGEERELFNLETEGTINSLNIQWDDALPPSASVLTKRLNEVTLAIYYDRKSTPSISMPFGAFFMQAYRMRPYRNISTAYLNNTFSSMLPMSFGKGIRVTLTNEGEMPIDVNFGYSLSKVRSSTSYLHAHWSRTDRMQSPQPSPHPIVSWKGQGHLSAVYLTTHSNDDDWFILEGDERMFVNGSFRPQWTGTGLEDYFNGAWYYTGLSDQPFAGLIEKAAMDTSQYRIHQPDPISFESSFRMEIEFGHPLGASGGANTSRGSITSVCYGYLDTPQNAETLPEISTRPPPQPRNFETKIMAEILELESIGETEAAKSRCELYAELAGGTKTGELLLLRSHLYENDLSVDNLSNVPPLQDSDAQKSLLLIKTIGANDDAALVHIVSSTAFTGYLNGKRSFQGNNPLALHTFQVKQSDLSNSELIFQIHNNGRVNAPWISVVVQNKKGLYQLPSAWSYRQAPPEGWPTLGLSTADGIWEELTSTPLQLPRMEAWKIQINPFPLVQSRPLLNLNKNIFKPNAQGGYWLRQLLPNTF